jgi:hypothetical protein
VRVSLRSAVKKTILTPILIVAFVSQTHAFEYGIKIETVQNANMPPVDIVQDTVTFRAIDELPQEMADLNSNEVQTNQHTSNKASHSRRHSSGLAKTSQARRSAPAGATQDAIQMEPALAYDASNENHSPFAPLRHIFGGAH